MASEAQIQALQSLKDKQWAEEEHAKTQPHNFSLGEMLGNAPGDLWQIGEEAAHMIRHPIDTASAVGNLALGGAQKLIPGEQDAEVYADAFMDDLIQKYGSWDSFKRELEANPAHVLMDIAPVGAVVGKGMKAAGLAKAGDITTKASMALDPVNMAMIAPRAARTGIAKLKPPADQYLSATKFSKVLDTKKGRGTRRKMANTAMKEKILPNQAGLTKIEGRLVEVNALIDEMVDAANDTGQKVPIHELQSQVIPLRNNAGGAKFEAAKDVATIDRVWGEFQDAMDARGITELGVRELQEFKKDLHTKINWNKKEMADPMVVQTKKAVDRAARQKLEELAPEIKDMNKLYGELKQLKDELMKVVPRIEDRDMGGIGVPIKIDAGVNMGRAIAGEPGAVVGGTLGGIAGAMDIPTLKARSAISQYHAGQRGIGDILSAQNPGLFAGRQFMQQLGEEALSQEELKKRKKR